jgi:hypothetical protein
MSDTGNDGPSKHPHSCVHHWKHVGAVGRVHSLNCERPTWFRCVWCGGFRWSRCGTGSVTKCAPCAAIKRGDVRAVARSGVPDNIVGMVALLTLTAPGRDVLPWDTDLCGHGPGECSGKRGCVVQAHPAMVWHRSLPRRWSWFVTYVRRMCGQVEFFKVYEWQERGALHVHVLARLPVGCSGALFRQACKSAARRWGFGPQCDVRWLPAGSVETEVRPGVVARSPRIAAAGYVAKYCSKGYDSLGHVEMLNTTTGEIYDVRLRPWSASRSWGDTMAVCRQRRIAWHAHGAGTSGQLADRRAAPGAAGALDPYTGTSTPTVGLAAVWLASLAASPV